jgi:hypothetical protein
MKNYRLTIWQTDAKLCEEEAITLSLSDFIVELAERAMQQYCIF